MANLAEYRAWLRLDLNDPAAGGAGVGPRFSDADLDRAIGRAVADLSAAWPRISDTEAALAAGSRTVALPPATFPGLLDVEEVEYPYGAGGAAATSSPSLPPWRLAPDRQSVTLVLDEAPAADTAVRVRWSAAYVVTEASGTVPAELDAVVARGAAGYAMLAYSTPALDNFK